MSSSRTLGKILKGKRIRYSVLMRLFIYARRRSRYVKLRLPEGVNTEGSEFRSLQERFEGVLIDKGLLQAKVGGEQQST